MVSFRVTNSTRLTNYPESPSGAAMVMYETARRRNELCTGLCRRRRSRNRRKNRIDPNAEIFRHK